MIFIITIIKYFSYYLILLKNSQKKFYAVVATNCSGEHSKIYKELAKEL